jgi:hypothetical protein
VWRIVLEPVLYRGADPVTIARRSGSRLPRSALPRLPVRGDGRPRRAAADQARGLLREHEARALTLQDGLLRLIEVPGAKLLLFEQMSSFMEGPRNASSRLYCR